MLHAPSVNDCRRDAWSRRQSLAPALTLGTVWCSSARLAPQWLAGQGWQAWQGIPAVNDLVSTTVWRLCRATNVLAACQDQCFSQGLPSVRHPSCFSWPCMGYVEGHTHQHWSGGSGRTDAQAVHGCSGLSSLMELPPPRQHGDLIQDGQDKTFQVSANSELGLGLWNGADRLTVAQTGSHLDFVIVTVAVKTDPGILYWQLLGQLLRVCNWHLTTGTGRCERTASGTCSDRVTVVLEVRDENRQDRWEVENDCILDRSLTIELQGTEHNLFARLLQMMEQLGFCR